MVEVIETELAAMKLKIPTLKCLRCGHQWVPRTPNVDRCPACKSFYWNEPDETKIPKGGRPSRK